MKICKIHLEDHPFFGNLDIDLTNPEGKPLDTIVFAGINGSGKTTILTRIFDMLEKEKIMQSESGNYFRPWTLNKEDQNSFLSLSIPKSEKNLLEKKRIKYFDFFRDTYFFENDLRSFSDKNKTDLYMFPKCVLMPTEIKFNNIEISAAPFKYEYKFLNIIDENITKNIPDYFGTYIDKKIYAHEDTSPKKSIQKACNEINKIFDVLDLESRLIGLKKDGSRMPIFANKLGDEFDINGLSSGEKQLFFRIMALKMVEANNSVILIDEPEISLHPAWQQKILKVYENVGENNQVIVATHSPHIIGSTNKENVKLLIRNKENDKFSVLKYEDIGVTKGAPTDRILMDLMGLKTTRDPDIQKMIDDLWSSIKKNKYNSKKFKIDFENLEKIIEPIDEDLILMKMEIGKREWEKSNVKN